MCLCNAPSLHTVDSLLWIPFAHPLPWVFHPFVFLWQITRFCLWGCGWWVVSWNLFNFTSPCSSLHWGTSLRSVTSSCLCIQVRILVHFRCMEGSWRPCAFATAASPSYEQLSEGIIQKKTPWVDSGKHVNKMFTGLSPDFWGDFVHVFFVPHKDWPEKTHTHTQKQISATHPDPGQSANLFMFIRRNPKGDGRKGTGQKMS